MTAARFWIVGLEDDRHGPPLCRVVGRPDRIDDPRFSDARDRFENGPELDAIFATRTLDEWTEVFAAEPDFFWSLINSLEDVVADEQFYAAGGIVNVPDGDVAIATPANFHGTQWTPCSVASELGQHTEEILAELKVRRGS